MEEEIDNLFKQAAQKEKGSFKPEFLETYKAGIATGGMNSKLFSISKIGFISIIGIVLVLVSTIAYVGFNNQNVLEEKGNLAIINAEQGVVDLKNNMQDNSLNSAVNKEETVNTLSIGEKEISTQLSEIQTNELSSTNRAKFLETSSDRTTGIEEKKESKKFLKTNSSNNSVANKKAQKSLLESNAKVSDNVFTNINKRKIEAERLSESSEQNVGAINLEEDKLAKKETSEQIAGQIDDLSLADELNENKPSEHANNTTNEDSKRNEIESTQINTKTEKNEKMEKEESIDEVSEIKNTDKTKNEKVLDNSRRLLFGGYKKDNLESNNFQKFRVNAKFGFSNDFHLAILSNNAGGYNFGLDFEYRFNSKLSISQGLGFYSRGVRKHTANYGFITIETSKPNESLTIVKQYSLYRFQFLELPFSVNWDITKKHRIGSGIILNTMLGSNYSVFISDNTVGDSFGELISQDRIRNTFLKDGFFRNSYSLHGYYQYNFNRLGLQLMYVHGVTPIMRETTFNTIENPKRIQFSMTYKLF